MPGDTPTAPRAAAVESLCALGLSTYAARTYVALAALGTGTATDVSETADVPRTRVYDAAEALRERGLVDVERSSPRRFRPVSTETATRRLRSEYEAHVETARAALDALAERSRPVEQRGVWTVTGSAAVTDRVVEFVDGAAETVTYTTGVVPADAVLAALRAASERGVTVRFAEPPGAPAGRVVAAVPDARRVGSPLDPSHGPLARALLVDGERALVSVAAGEDDETAIWGSGTENGLAVVIRALFGAL